MIKPTDLVYRYPKVALGIAIFLAFLSVSFQFNGKSIKLIWNYPLIAVALLSLSIALMLLYVEVVKKEIGQLTSQIATDKSNLDNNVRLEELTDRERQVYKLIIAGKANHRRAIYRTKHPKNPH